MLFCTNVRYHGKFVCFQISRFCVIKTEVTHDLSEAIMLHDLLMFLLELYGLLSVTTFCADNRPVACSSNVGRMGGGGGFNGGEDHKTNYMPSENLL
jgi:hypothetical protein